MNKIRTRVLLIIAAMICIAANASSQYSKSIKLDFTASFDTPFGVGQSWSGVNQETVEAFIESRVTDDYSPYGIGVSTTTGNMVVSIGGTSGTFLGQAQGIGVFVDATDVTANVYSTYFSTFQEWQGANATVVRIGEAIAGTVSHEIAHLLNCRHAFASDTFDPAISNHLYPNTHLPKEPADLVGTTGDDYAYKYTHLMASGAGGWITLEQRATINRTFSDHSDFTIDFGISGGTNIDYFNSFWGIPSRTWNQATNVTINNGKTFVMAGPSYSHNLNGYYIKAVSGEIIYYNGLSGTYYKITDPYNTELYGLYPSSASALANVTTAQAVLDQSDNVIYPTAVPTAPSSFDIDGDIGDHPYLYWSGSTGIITGYNIYRKESSGSTWEWLDYTTSTNYTDISATIEDEEEEEVDEYDYHIKAWNAKGESPASVSRSLYAIIEWKMSDNTNKIPKEFALQNNYPNPFNPMTQIKYQLPEATHVTLIVYNMLGQVVAQLVNEYKPAGYHSAWFDATYLASGTYIYKITAGSHTMAKRMVLIK